jgi:homoserine dehydrogenase
VQPSFIPQSHILASVSGVFNAIAVHGDLAGDALFYGRGAGREPTASAVIADLVEIGRGLASGGRPQGFVPYRETGVCLPVAETSTPYYVRLDVTDRPGVLAEISRVLADAGVGISGTHSPVNPESPDEDFVDMVLQLHSCPFGRLQETLARVEALDCVNRSPVVFRIEKL